MKRRTGSSTRASSSSPPDSPANGLRHLGPRSPDRGLFVGSPCRLPRSANPRAGGHRGVGPQVEPCAPSQASSRDQSALRSTPEAPHTANNTHARRRADGLVKTRDLPSLLVTCSLRGKHLPPVVSTIDDVIDRPFELEPQVFGPCRQTLSRRISTPRAESTNSGLTPYSGGLDPVLRRSDPVLRASFAAL